MRCGCTSKSDRSVVDEVWARNAPQALSEDEALALAYDELKAMRRERGTDKAAS